jgi:VWFA-related protein
LVDSPARSQDAQAPAAPTVSVDVKVVTLPVTVRDKKGQIVRNLTKDDFVLQEDGRPQVIKYFAQDTNLPLTLGLLVDTSLSQRNVLDQERNASKVFLDQMLTDAKDKAFLIHFDREVELLQDLTSSHDKLQAGLELLRTPQLDRNGGGSSGPQSSDPQSSPGSGSGQPRMSRGAGTLLYDAIFLASDELMKKQQGRKALIVLSDGDDRGSKESLQSAIEAAQRADTVVYSILFADHHQQDSGGFGGPGGGGMGRHGGGWPGGGGGWPGGGGSGGGGRGSGRYPQETRVDGKKILEQISKETGGRLYEVSKKQAIDQIYDSIAEELRTQYNLGYTPDKANPEAGYHKISLVAKPKDLVVQTRNGYYADR